MVVQEGGVGGREGGGVGGGGGGGGWSGIWNAGWVGQTATKMGEPNKGI